MNLLKRFLSVYESRLVFVVAALVFVVLLGFCFQAWQSGEDAGMRSAAVGGGLMVLVQYYRRQRSKV
nr:hypothetical protein [uncultured Arsenicibacter sp.]